MIGPIARQRTKGDLLLSTPIGRIVLDALGIQSIDDAAACGAGTVVSAGTKRRVRRIAVEGVGDVYLKVATGGGTRHVLRELLRRGRRRSSSRIEFENAVELSHSGLPVAEPLAAGERLRGLREDLSFVISKGVPGRSLEEIVSTADSSDRESDLTARLVDFVRSFLQAGRYPRDFVAKHVFFDDLGGVRLIDVFALDRGRPSDFEKSCAMIARLGASVRAGDAGIVAARRFLRAIFDAQGSAALARVRAEAERLMRDRRHRRFVVVGDRTNSTVTWRRSTSQRFFVDARYTAWFEARGISADTVPEDSEIERHAAGDRTLRFQRLDELSARRVFNAYHACASQMPVAPMMAIRMESAPRPSWILTDCGQGPALPEALSTIDEGARSALVVESLRRLAALVDSGYCPSDRITDWLQIDGGTVRLVFRPEILAVEPSRAAAIWARLLTRFEAELESLPTTSLVGPIREARTEGWPPRRLLASGPIR